MIRPATLGDLESILHIAAAHAEAYPLRADLQKMRQIGTEAISSAKHFCWVGEYGSHVTGALVGLTSENMWAQRQNCQVVLWDSQTGDGAALLRKFAEWVKSRRAIKVAGMAPDLDGIDPRAWKLAERIGFEKHGGAYLLYN